MEVNDSVTEEDEIKVTDKRVDLLKGDKKDLLLGRKIALIYTP